MPSLPLRRRLALTARNLAACVLFVVVIVLMKPLAGTSMLASLIIVLSLIFVFSTLKLWAAGREEEARPPGDPAGDRSPRRPSPFRPSSAIERPLPGA